MRQSSKRQSVCKTYKLPSLFPPLPAPSPSMCRTFGPKCVGDARLAIFLNIIALEWAHYTVIRWTSRNIYLNCVALDPGGWSGWMIWIGEPPDIGMDGRRLQVLIGLLGVPWWEIKKEFVRIVCWCQVWPPLPWIANIRLVWQEYLSLGSICKIVVLPSFLKGSLPDWITFVLSTHPLSPTWTLQCKTGLWLYQFSGRTSVTIPYDKGHRRVVFLTRREFSAIKLEAESIGGTSQGIT